MKVFKRNLYAIICVEHKKTCVSEKVECPERNICCVYHCKCETFNIQWIYLQILSNYCLCKSWPFSPLCCLDIIWEKKNRNILKYLWYILSVCRISIIVLEEIYDQFMIHGTDLSPGLKKLSKVR